ncbi:hypothetical protein Dimus_017992 [Dionaea muscipula]
MTVIHLKKKDIVKSSVKGVAVEFDHERLASILGIPGNNGIFEGNTLGEKFYDVEDKDQGSPEVRKEIQRRFYKVQLSRRNKVLQESTPRVLLDEFQMLNC